MNWKELPLLDCLFLQDPFDSGRETIRHMPEHFIGIDVGTGSARAGVFDAGGKLLASAKADIRIWRETGDIVEQSSDDIWGAVCKSVREAVSTGIPPQSIAELASMRRAHWSFWVRAVLLFLSAPRGIQAAT